MQDNTQTQAVRTQNVSEGGPKFCRNRVTSQINLESAEGTTIIGWSGSMPRKNFAKLHLKICTFVYSGSKF